MGASANVLAMGEYRLKEWLNSAEKYTYPFVWSCVFLKSAHFGSILPGLPWFHELFAQAHVGCTACIKEAQ